jgi:hypothetical protein
MPLITFAESNSETKSSSCLLSYTFDTAMSSWYERLPVKHLFKVTHVFLSSVSDAGCEWRTTASCFRTSRLLYRPTQWQSKASPYVLFSLFMRQLRGTDQVDFAYSDWPTTAASKCLWLRPNTERNRLSDALRHVRSVDAAQRDALAPRAPGRCCGRAEKLDGVSLLVRFYRREQNEIAALWC